jgi:hypothetical protein
VTPRYRTIEEIPDELAIQRVEAMALQFSSNQMKLVAVTKDGTKEWTLAEEIAEMKAHTTYGMEMLQVHKMAILEDLKLGRR